MKLTTHLNLVLGLKMSGAIPLLPWYPFMAWTGTALLCEGISNMKIIIGLNSNKRKPGQNRTWDKDIKK